MARGPSWPQDEDLQSDKIQMDSTWIRMAVHTEQQVNSKIFGFKWCPHTATHTHQ